jgi:hypothetical protein
MIPVLVFDYYGLHGKYISMSEIDIAYSIVLASVILLLEIFGKEFEE